MAKNTKKNYLMNLSYQLLVMMTPLITTPYLSRILGADGIGMDSYIQSVVSYFTLFATLGLTTFGQREISYVQDDKEKRTLIFWETNILELIFSSICIAAYIIFSLHQEQKNLYLVVVFNLISVIANITWFFQGLEAFGKIIFRNFIFKFINIAFVFAFIHSKEDLIWYMLGTSFFTFISNVSLWPYIPKYVGKPILKDLKPFRHFKTVISLFVPTVAIQLYTVLDKTMIGLITSNAFENGYYEQAIKLSKIVMTIVTSLGTVMIPRIGFHYKKGNTEEIRRLMYRGYRFVWCIGIPLCLGLFSIAENFVPWFFGSGFERVIPLLRILCFLIVAIGISNVTGTQYLLPTKRQSLFTLTVIVGAITNFVLNLILIPKFAAIGAAVASVFAETVIAVVQIILVRNELKPYIIVSEGIHYYIGGLCMLVVLMFLNHLFLPSIVNTIIMIMIGSIVYLGVLLIVHDNFLIDNLLQIFKKVKKKNV